MSYYNCKNKRHFLLLLRQKLKLKDGLLFLLVKKISFYSYTVLTAFRVDFKESWKLYTKTYEVNHCVKNVYIRSFSGPDFSDIRSISPFLVRILKNTDQKNSEYGHFSCCNNCTLKLHSLNLENFNYNCS